MEEQSSLIKGLAKTLGRVILIDILIIAIVCIYFWPGIRSTLYEFGEILISIGGAVSVIGFFISTRPFSPSAASGVYRIANPDQIDMREKRMKMYFAEQKKVAAGRLTIVLVGISTFLIGIGIQGFCCQPSSPIKEPLLEVEMLSAKDMYPEAYSLAFLWSENATLNEIGLYMIGPDERLSINIIHFNFISTEFPDKFLSVRCNYSNCGSSVHDSTDSELTPFKFEEVKIDSIEAVQIGLANGGKEYMQSAGGSGNVTLRWSKENTLEWALLFHCDAYGRMYIYIDPYTGELIEK